MKDYYTPEEMKEIGIHLVNVIKQDMEIDAESPKSFIELRIELSKTTVNPNTQYDCTLHFQTKNKSIIHTKRLNP